MEIEPLTEENVGRILVIDDEESIRMMLQQALEIAGFEVESAGDGQEGLDIFRGDTTFGVILTDLMMPKVNGMEVLEQAKKHDPDVELIMLTGFGGQDSAIEAMKKGAYDYLQKPTNVEELFITVKKAFERRRLSVENREYQKNLERLVRDRTRELSETKNFLQNVLDSSLDYSIVTTDPEGFVTLFNRGSERLTGTKEAQVIGKKKIEDFIPGWSDESDSASDSLKPEKGKTKETECILVKSDEDEVNVSMSIAALTNQNGKMVGTLYIAKDITEQKELELELKKYTENLEHLVKERTEELEKQNAELEKTLHELSDAQQQLLQSEKMASIGQLAAGVAHEINNPIGFVHSNLNTMRKFNSRVVALLDTLKKESGNAAGLTGEAFGKIWSESKVERLLPELETMISESMDGTQRVRTIVSDLKNFSNIDRAQIQDASLEAGLDSTLNIVWNEIKYNATVEKEYGNVPPVSSNPQQLNQVFLNLLVNAAHAIKQPPGKITIRTKSLDKERVAVEVQDNGCGIPPDIKKRIFDPFYTTKPIGEGTGLGLSISYRIIKEHGGEIQVESEVGVGTTFRVILPIKGPMSEKVEDHE